jgi:hypothetical protein
MTGEAHTGSLRGQSQVDRLGRAYAARGAPDWILVPRVSQDRMSAVRARLPSAGKSPEFGRVGPGGCSSGRPTASGAVPGAPRRQTRPPRCHRASGGVVAPFTLAPRRVQGDAADPGPTGAGPAVRGRGRRPSRALNAVQRKPSPHGPQKRQHVAARREGQPEHVYAQRDHEERSLLCGPS